MQTSVLIVGGGVVGLATAIELGWRGQDVIVVDEGDGTIDHPRTGSVSARSMEFCRRWGIVDEVRACGFPDDYALDIVFCTSMKGFDLVRAPFPSMRDMPTPQQGPEKRQRCPQMWLDPIFARTAAAMPTVTVRYRTRIDDLVMDPDGSVTGLGHDLDSGEPVTISARYAVGCDGASSAVRRALDIGTTGNPLLNYSINVMFRAPRLLEQTGQGEAARFIVVTPTGTLGNVTVVNGTDLWRFTYIHGKERPDLETLDIASKLQQALGEGVDFTIEDVAPWRRTELVADAYRSGPIFLAGDAVHTMSPTGGFGANTGIGDGIDLGWKLDAVLRGWGGEALLDSYEAERRPIAFRNAGASTRNLRGWHTEQDASRLLDPGPEADQVRQAIGAELLGATSEEWTSLGVVLGYRYEDSPICVPDGSPAPPDTFSEYEQTNRAGARAPHAWLAPGESTLDLFGRGFVLVDRQESETESKLLLQAGETLGVPLTRVELPAALTPAYTTRFTLVRPDGHVAWRGDDVPDDVEQLLSTVSGR